MLDSSKAVNLIVVPYISPTSNRSFKDNVQGRRNDNTVKSTLSFRLLSVYLIAGIKKKIAAAITNPISLVSAINASEMLNINRVVLAGLLWRTISDRK